MNKILITLTFLFVNTIIFSQTPEGLKLRVGLRASIPISEFGTLYSFGIGGELHAEYGFNDKLSGIVTTGYSSFLGKSLDLGFGSVKLPAFGFIPALAGVRFYASDMFFIGGQVGYGLYSAEGESEGGLNYQPQIGINLEKFQLSLNYNSTKFKDADENFNHIGLTAVYKIGE